MAKRTRDAVTTLSVGVPDDLDKLLNTLSEPRSADWAHEPGEHLFVTERLVVSPGAGLFRPGPGGRPRLDVRAANVRQLLDAGLLPGALHHVADCTRSVLR